MDVSRTCGAVECASWQRVPQDVNAWVKTRTQGDGYMVFVTTFGSKQDQTITVSNAPGADMTVSCQTADGGVC
jgi:hypothetical protein